jgi:hypothetical protein
MLPICAPQIAAAVKNGEKISIFFGRAPSLLQRSGTVGFQKKPTIAKKKRP